LDAARLETVDVTDRRFDHGETVVGTRQPAVTLLPGIVRDHEQQPIEAQGMTRVDRDHEVSDVGRIERTAEDSEALAHQSRCSAASLARKASSAGEMRTSYGGTAGSSPRSR